MWLMMKIGIQQSILDVHLSTVDCMIVQHCINYNFIFVLQHVLLKHP